LLVGVTNTAVDGSGGPTLFNSYITIADEGEPEVIASVDVGDSGATSPVESDPPDIGNAPLFLSDSAERGNLDLPVDPQTADVLDSASRGTEIVVYPPDRIRIPAIALDAPVIPVSHRLVKLDGQVFNRWLAPNEFAGGWHDTSVPLNVPGNTVVNGHNNIYGDVFRRLAELVPGDRIMVYSGVDVFVYQVTNQMTLLEKYQSVETRLSNAQWLQKSDDERLTLVTCWPEWGNSHRLIIVAKPVNHFQDFRSMQ